MLAISSASFYFWMDGYSPHQGIELAAEYGNDLVDAIDVYVTPTKVQEFFDQATDTHLECLSGFKARILHTDFADLCDWASAPLSGAELSKVISEFNDLAKYINATEFVIHADFLVGDIKERLSILESCFTAAPINLEVVDHKSNFGTHPEHFEEILKTSDRVFLTPDIAHMQDFAQDYSWEAFFDNPKLLDKIRVIHLSHHTRNMIENWYVKKGFVDVAEANHTLCIADVEAFPREMLSRFSDKLIVLEGIIPTGDEGLRMLDDEICWVKQNCFNV
ncbi:sugar phosphate isomerase/epimerase family protein [Curvivirga sp.]|uniref:sugar phosphate isomerase/epimerase family protein n=1 Tax=Curvivirga sp. TaxID=2856848 RepID=UPI003B5AACC1